MRRRTLVSILGLGLGVFVPLWLGACAAEETAAGATDATADTGSFDAAPPDDSTQPGPSDTAGPDAANPDAALADAGGGDVVTVTDTGVVVDATADVSAGDAATDVGADAATAWPVKATFPPGFLFGTAVAGFQVDMGCPTLPAAQCDDPNSDWYAFVTSPETVDDPNTYIAGDPVSAGPGFWELYEQDFDRAKDELDNNALRFSLEWSRIFPTATDGVEGYEALKAIASPEALATYHDMLAKLRARGLEPLVTLNHYTLPTWIHDGVGCHVDLANCSPRGWLDKDRTVGEIAKYAGFVAQEFGGEVDLWATENEPLAIVLPGYLQPSPDRTNPPAVGFQAEAAKVVIAGLVEAHARMYDAVKAADLVDANGDGKPSVVGLVYNMGPVAPQDPGNPADVEAAEGAFYLWNLAFLDAVVAGDYDENLDGNKVHRADLEDRMDYLGVNYYTRIKVQGLGSPILPDFSPLLTINPLTIIPWEDYPRGLFEMAVLVKERYGVPIIVTENGTQDPHDEDKIALYVVQHLTWLSRAIVEGVDVRGYFYWTLLDNYEWNHGMGIRMGMYAVDKDDPEKKRVARKGVAVYSEIAKNNEIPVEIAEKYPTP